MELRCPDCVSPEVEPNPRESADAYRCANCGAHFHRDATLVTLADAENYAEEQSACTCDRVRSCPQCFQKADELVGATVRDHLGREWEVEDIGEKNGFPTIRGAFYWDRPDEVEVLKEAV
ncbi:MAG TPA: hypothetical protein VNY83_01365 [Solirubrobacterales bacterium]|jgi:hypothetical protein|nr:hypothetical protein [Solirubrobacterales bacterium]